MGAKKTAQHLFLLRCCWEILITLVDIAFSSWARRKPGRYSIIYIPVPLQNCDNFPLPCFRCNRVLSTYEAITYLQFWSACVLRQCKKVFTPIAERGLENAKMLGSWRNSQAHEFQWVLKISPEVGKMTVISAYLGFCCGWAVCSVSFHFSSFWSRPASSLAFHSFGHVSLPLPVVIALHCPTQVVTSDVDYKLCVYCCKSTLGEPISAADQVLTKNWSLLVSGYVSILSPVSETLYKCWTRGIDAGPSFWPDSERLISLRWVLICEEKLFKTVRNRLPYIHLITSDPSFDIQHCRIAFLQGNKSALLPRFLRMEIYFRHLMTHLSSNFKGLARLQFPCSDANLQKAMVIQQYSGNLSLGWRRFMSADYASIWQDLYASIWQDLLRFMGCCVQLMLAALQEL